MGVEYFSCCFGKEISEKKEHSDLVDAKNAVHMRVKVYHYPTVLVIAQKAREKRQISHVIVQLVIVQYRARAHPISFMLLKRLKKVKLENKSL